MGDNRSSSGKETVAELAERLRSLSRAEARGVARLLAAKWRVTADRPRAYFPVTWDPVPPGFGERPAKFDIVVVDAGAHPVNVIRELRSIMELGVMETRARIAALPLVVARDVDSDQAARLKSRLEEGGATVDVKPV